MKKVLVQFCTLSILSFFGFLFSYQNIAYAANTIKIYPTSDAVGQLYDDDAISDWTSARNYQGELFRTPFESGLLDNVGNIAVRSDNGVGTYRIYRVSDVFDLTGLPANANLTKATLKLYKSVPNNRGDISVVITSHHRDLPGIYQKKDWIISNFGNKEFSRSVLVDTQYTDFTFNNDGLNYLQSHRSDVATIGILTSFDFDNTIPQGFILAAGWYEVENTGTEFDPYLEITYEVPETNRFPLYTQTVSAYPSIAETTSWANESFAGGTAGPHCPTIAACGCTITSTVMLARSYGITRGIDGSEVNPGNFNRWLTANHGYKGAGNLDFSQGMKYFGIEENGVQKSYFKSKDSPLSDSAVRQRVASGVPVVSQMNAKFRRNSEERGPHFVLVTELLGGGQYGVNDPIWFNTKNLDDDVTRAAMVQDYNDHITNGRDLTFSRTPVVVAKAFSSSLIGQGSGTSISLAFVRTTTFLATGGQSEFGTAPAEMFISTPGGGRLGYDPRAGQSYKLTNGYYGNEAFLSDPLDENTAPVTDVLKTLSASELSTGLYKVYVVGTGSGAYKYAGLVHDASGHEHPFMYTSETASGMVDVYQFDSTTGEFKLLPIDAPLFKGVIDGEIKDATLNRFFTMWAEKIMGEIKDGKMTQAREHIETFKTLMKAKKVDSPALNLLLQKLAAQVG